MVAIDDPERVLSAYPHQLSGGQAQRVMLALALAGNPRLLIADEPTSSLDLVTRREILNLVDRLVERRGLGLLLISHDLRMVHDAVDRLVVMFAGEIVEEGPADMLFRDPLHPYTRTLLARKAEDHLRRRSSVSSSHPNSVSTLSERCGFSFRCSLRRSSCLQARPELVEFSNGRQLRCPIVAATGESCRVEH